MKKVVVTGGSGFVGGALVKSLVQKGYVVLVVDKFPPREEISGSSFMQIDTEKEGFPEGFFEGVYGVINLAGAPIAKKWTKEYKDAIYFSRIETTKHVVDGMRSANQKPEVLVSASAVGFYGDGKDKLLTEDDPSGNDFLAKVCLDWEMEAKKAEEFSRVVCLRTSHVIGTGGILRELFPLFEKNIGGYFGSGSQYMPWVSLEDLVSQYIFALENKEMSGAYNTSAGEPVTQKTFMKTIQKVVGSPWCLPIPKFAARIAKGEMANIFFGGQKTDSTKIKNAGFNFSDTNLGEVIRRSYTN